MDNQSIAHTRWNCTYHIVARAFRWGRGYHRTVISYFGMMVSLVMIVRFLDCA